MSHSIVKAWRKLWVFNCFQNDYMFDSLCRRGGREFQRDEPFGKEFFPLWEIGGLPY